MRVEIVETNKTVVDLEEYWVIRGLKFVNGCYKVVTEKQMICEPNELDIAQFLIENKKYDVQFAGVEHNYRISEEELPF